MIIYITTELDISDNINSLSGLTHDNDVIVIHVFHPYEVIPYSDLLFAGLSLSKNGYQKEFEKKKNDVRKAVLKSGGEYLCMTTDISGVQYMNNFFKNRFSRTLKDEIIKYQK